MAKFIKRIQEELKNCPKCLGERHIGIESEKSRCACYDSFYFLQLFKAAKGREDLVKVKKYEQIQKLLKKHDTILIIEHNKIEQLEWKHSSLYWGSKYWYKSEAFADIDVSTSIFNQTGVEKREFELQRFLNPDLLFLELGTINNKDFLSIYLFRLIQSRYGDAKKTVLLVPNTGAIVARYNDKDLSDYLTESLINRDAYIGPAPKKNK